MHLSMTDLHFRAVWCEPRPAHAIDTHASFLCGRGRALPSQVCCHVCALSAQTTHSTHHPKHTHTDPPKTGAPGKARGFRRKGPGAGLRQVRKVGHASPADESKPRGRAMLWRRGDRSPPRHQCPGERTMALTNPDVKNECIWGGAK